MTTEKNTLTMKISDIFPPAGSEQEPMPVAAFQKKFLDAGFTMAKTQAEGIIITQFGNLNMGIAYPPHTFIDWSGDSVTFEEGDPVPVRKIDATGRTVE